MVKGVIIYNQEKHIQVLEISGGIGGRQSTEGGIGGTIVYTVLTLIWFNQIKCNSRLVKSFTGTVYVNCWLDVAGKVVVNDTARLDIWGKFTAAC